MENELAPEFTIASIALTNVAVAEACESSESVAGTTLCFRTQSAGGPLWQRSMQRPKRGPMIHRSDDSQPQPLKEGPRFVSRLNVIWVNEHAPDRVLSHLHDWGRSQLGSSIGWFKEPIHTPTEASSTHILDAFFGEDGCHGK